MMADRVLLHGAGSEISCDSINNNNNNNGFNDTFTSFNKAINNSKYSELVSIIEDVGREVRPSYSGNKTSAERLKKGIVQARMLVRECLVENEKNARQ